MTQLCLPRPKALPAPPPVSPRGLGAGEGPSGAARAHVSSWDPSQARLLDSALGLGALGLTIRAIFSMAGLALLLLLLLCFLAFDLLHRPASRSLPQHRRLSRGQNQGAGLLASILGWRAGGAGREDFLIPSLNLKDLRPPTLGSGYLGSESWGCWRRWGPREGAQGRVWRPSQGVWAGSSHSGLHCVSRE
nr:uncharacterized protein C20orf141 homolog isoform X1 [Oryctolagus cuniculus]